MRFLLALLLAALPLSARPAVDVLSLWDFARPEVSEARFREAASSASPEDAAILQTQIARTYGLRRDFARAREILARLEPELPERGPEARARHQLEYGRTLVSATHSTEEKTPQARAAARKAYLAAFEIARASALDYLAIDALHMLPFVETAPAAGLHWNEQALALALQSAQPDARRWEPSLRNNIGYSLHQLGRYDEALAAFEANVPVTQRLGNAARTRVARWMVAWTLRSLGRLDQAIAIQLQLERECADAGQPDPHVHDELAKLYAATGDARQAALYRDLHARHRSAQK